MKKSKILKCSLDANLEVNSRNSMVEKLFSDETEKVAGKRQDKLRLSHPLALHAWHVQRRREGDDRVSEKERETRGWD